MDQAALAAATDDTLAPLSLQMIQTWTKRRSQQTEDERPDSFLEKFTMAGGGTVDMQSDADGTTFCYGLSSGHLVINKAKPFHYRVSKNAVDL